MICYYILPWIIEINKKKHEQLHFADFPTTFQHVSKRMEFSKW